MKTLKCQKCEEILAIDDTVKKFTCPKCGKKQEVPAGIAALPTPKLSSGTNLEEEIGIDKNDSPAMRKLASAMPFVISTFLHMGIFLLATCIIFINMAVQGAPINIPVPDCNMSEQPGSPVVNPSDVKTKSDTPSTANNKSLSKERIKVGGMTGLNSGSTDGKGVTDIIGVAGNTGNASGGGIGGSDQFGLGNGGGNQYPRTNFQGLGGSFKDVVFVIDRSGSMMEHFDELKYEMIKSISHMSSSQTFHIIFFATGKPIEMSPSTLKPAQIENKREALNFLKEVTTSGQTDLLPALQRGYAVLNNSRESRKLIYLLTDGEFENEQAVLNFVKQNPTVTVCTFLYGSQSAKAEAILKQIAEESKGSFKKVEVDD